MSTVTYVFSGQQLGNGVSFVTQTSSPSSIAISGQASGPGSGVPATLSITIYVDNIAIGTATAPAGANSTDLVALSATTPPGPSLAWAGVHRMWMGVTPGPAQGSTVIPALGMFTVTVTEMDQTAGL